MAAGNRRFKFDDPSPGVLEMKPPETSKKWLQPFLKQPERFHLGGSKNPPWPSWLWAAQDRKTLLAQGKSPGEAGVSLLLALRLCIMLSVRPEGRRSACPPTSIQNAAQGEQGPRPLNLPLDENRCVGRRTEPRAAIGAATIERTFTDPEQPVTEMMALKEYRKHHQSAATNRPDVLDSALLRAPAAFRPAGWSVDAPHQGELSYP